MGSWLPSVRVRMKNDSWGKRRGNCVNCCVSSPWSGSPSPFLLSLLGPQLPDLFYPVTCHPSPSGIGWLPSREQWPAASLAVHEWPGQRSGASDPWRGLPAQRGPHRHGAHLLHSGEHRLDRGLRGFSVQTCCNRSHTQVICTLELED